MIWSLTELLRAAHGEKPRRELPLPEAPSGAPRLGVPGPVLPQHSHARVPSPRSILAGAQSSPVSAPGPPGEVAHV